MICISWFTEPNILSHTTHSISKKGVKKRDLNDLELRNILAEILPLVRIDHVIPHNCDVMNSAIKRGLLSTPPSHMYEDEVGHKSQICAWIRGKSASMFMRPRLFTPYFEETKVNSSLKQDLFLQYLFTFFIFHSIFTR